MNFGIDVLELYIFSLKRARDNSGKPTVLSFWTRRGFAANSPTQLEFKEAGLRPKKNRFTLLQTDLVVCF
jgi:hypothetical protein